MKTTPIEAKDSYFANVKSNNYLQNALVVMDAESEQLHQVKLRLDLCLSPGTVL